MAVLLALGGALAYGLSDFIGGVAARRTSVWPVAFTACLGATIGTVALAALVPGEATAAHYGWGLLGGVGSGTGTAFLYRGLASGRMGVVAPVSAVGAALLPAALGIATGERPSVIVWVGLLVALPGIWLVSREPAGAEVRTRGAEGLLDGLIAGLGFGALFAALGQVPEEAGFWPVAACQLVSVVVVVLAALLLSANPTPRLGHAGADWWGLGAGVLATLAVVAFMLARQQGLLSVAAVLTSLYPAATVMLATLLLHEKLHREQSFGLLLCAGAVVCVALG